MRYVHNMAQIIVVCFLFVCAWLVFRFCKPVLIRGKQYLFAVIMNRVAPRYNRLMHRRKEQLFSRMKAGRDKLRVNYEVLEIGAGSGANFQFYPEGTNITCVDPNPNFDYYLKSNNSKFPHINLKEFVVAKAEDMSMVMTGSVDAVVCTLVLCTVEDVDQCLREVKRVLKPGGQFFYMEHVAADRNSFLNKLQRLLNPVWRIAGDGCNIVRETGQHVSKAGFAEVDQEHIYIQIKGLRRNAMFPVVIKPHVVGVATK